MGDEDWSIPETIAPWPARRISRAIAAALDSGALTEWATLRDLAAAYGLSDLALAAHCKASEPNPHIIAPPPETKTEATTKRKKSPQPRAGLAQRPVSRRRAREVVPDDDEYSGARPGKGGVLNADAAVKPLDPSANHTIRIRSAVPQARAAWFERWSRARGLGAAQRTGDDFVIEASAHAASVLAELLDHPEFEIEAGGV